MKKRIALILSILLIIAMSMVMLPACGEDEVEEEVATVVAITITTNPDSMSFGIGANFDATGMVVTATYSDGSSKVITDYTIVGGTSLSQSLQKVRIDYTENDVKVYAYLDIEVREFEVTSLEFDAPTVNSYVAGEPFDESGMKVYAIYENGSRSEVSNYSVLTETVPANGEIQVKVDDVTDTFTTNVRSATISSLTITAQTADLESGEMLTTYITSVVANYSDNVTRTISNKYYTCSLTTALKESDTTATITYAGVSAVLNFNVITTTPRDYIFEAEGLTVSSTAGSNVYANTASVSRGDISAGSSVSGTYKAELDYSGIGYLSSYGSAAHSIQLKITADQSASASLFMTSYGSETLSSLFEDITLNGTSIKTNEGYSDATTFEASAFSESDIADIMLAKGDNVISFEVAGSIYQPIDFLRLSTIASIEVTDASDINDVNWVVDTAPTATTAGLIYRYIDDGITYEEVEVPMIGDSALKAGATVSATAYTNGYVPYTYTDDNGVAYTFNVKTADATGETTRTYIDFEDADSLVAHEAGARVELLTQDTSYTNGIGTPSASSNLTDDEQLIYVSSSSAVSYAGLFTHGWANRGGQGTATMTFTSDVDASISLYAMAAATKTRDTYLDRHIRVLVNGEILDEEEILMKASSTSGWFDYYSVLLGNIDIKAGTNTIEYIGLGGWATNVEGIQIESSSTIASTVASQVAVNGGASYNGDLSI